MTDILPLQVASGVLIAALVIFAFRYIVALAHRGRMVEALFLSVPLVLMGGALIAAGLGIVAY
jgi:hypothetical protein